MAPESMNFVEVRVRGHWVKVPAVSVSGNNLIAAGKWLRIARVRGEEMMKNELEYPEVYIQKLMGEAKNLLKADIFTFTQKLPVSKPKYFYPVEWESVAAIHLI